LQLSGTSFTPLYFNWCGGGCCYLLLLVAVVVILVLWPWLFVDLSDCSVSGGMVVVIDVGVVVTEGVWVVGLLFVTGRG
jgi:hypothetical protein